MASPSRRRGVVHTEDAPKCRKARCCSTEQWSLPPLLLRAVAAACLATSRCASRAHRVGIAPPPPLRQQSAADIRLTSLSGMQATERRPRSAGGFVAFAGSVHLASFLRAVSRKSLISLICFGCEHAKPSTTR